MDNYRDLTVKDFTNGAALEYMRSRIISSDAGIEKGKYDSFGLHLDTISVTMTVFLFMYKFYFHADVHGLENLPTDGPGVMISNHAPILPIDAAMLVTAGLVEPEQPRFIRTIVNKSISTIPYFSTLISRSGQIIGCDENVRRCFENKNLILIFPTGAEGEVHTIFDKYRIAEFPLGFMEYALSYNTLVIPTCVTGSEEAGMVLAGIDLPVGGFKHFPISPIFPWFGLLGLLPFPSKFDIYYEQPMDFYTDHSKDADNPEIVKELSENVRQKIQSMLDSALGRQPQE